MTCILPADGILSCNLKINDTKNNFIDVLYTDLLLDQCNITKDFNDLLSQFNIFLNYDNDDYDNKKEKEKKEEKIESSRPKQQRHRSQKPLQQNVIFICDDITTVILNKKLKKPNDDICIISAEILKRKYNGKSSSEKNIKVIRKPNLNAYKINEIHKFANTSLPTVIFLINFYHINVIDRLYKDNKGKIENIHVVLNALVEFPFIYMTEKTFKIYLTKYSAVDDSDTCNYATVNLNASKTTKVLRSELDCDITKQNCHRYNDQYTSHTLVTINDIINDVISNSESITASDRPNNHVYVFDIRNCHEQLLMHNKIIYRCFKIFYFTYVFHNVKWSIVPNDKLINSLYIFKRYFAEEMSIISKWWPDNETINIIWDKLRRWCPIVFDSPINYWFFTCNVRDCFLVNTLPNNNTHSSTKKNNAILPRLTVGIASRPIVAGGHIWTAPTLAYMSLARVSVGMTTELHLNIMHDDVGTKTLSDYYRYIFDIV